MGTMDRMFGVICMLSLVLFCVVCVLWFTRPIGSGLVVRPLFEFERQGRRWSVDSVPKGITISDRPELDVEDARLARAIEQARAARESYAKSGLELIRNSLHKINAATPDEAHRLN